MTNFATDSQCIRAERSPGELRRRRYLQIFRKLCITLRTEYRYLLLCV